MTERRLDRLAAALPRRLGPRATSLIVTLWGDAIVPHGGRVRLKSLIALAAPFGLNERAVRTAVFRLAADGWLAATKLGRESAYGLTEFGQRAVLDAAHQRRIYSGAAAAWDGRWTVAFLGLGRLARPARERLRRELVWLGFGQLAPGVFAHPTAEAAALGRALARLGVERDVAVIEAGSAGAAASDLLRRAWDLDGLAAAYRRFLAAFRPVWAAVERDDAPAPAAAFVLRALVVHEFRRVSLRDPELPVELLPPDWAGSAARVLARNLYRRLAEPARRHLMHTLETPEGPAPEPGPAYWRRFGGLPGAPDVPAAETRAA